MTRAQIVRLVDNVVLYRIGGSYSVQYRQDGLLFVFTRKETRDAVDESLTQDNITTRPENDLALFVPDQS